MEKVYTIKKMKCAGCANKITATLEQLAGVKKIDIKLAEQTVNVSFDDQKIKAQQIEEALSHVGYPVD